MLGPYLTSHDTLTNKGLEQAIRDGMKPVRALRAVLDFWDPTGSTSGQPNVTFGSHDRRSIDPKLVARSIASIMAGQGGTWAGQVHHEYERALLLQAGELTVEEILAPIHENWIATANDAMGPTHGGEMSPRQKRLFAEKKAELEALANHDLCDTVGCLEDAEPLGTKIQIKRAGESEFTPTGGRTHLNNPPPEEDSSSTSTTTRRHSSSEPEAGPENPQGLTDRQSAEVSTSSVSASTSTVAGALAGIDPRVLVALAIAAAVAGWLVWRSR